MKKKRDLYARRFVSAVCAGAAIGLGATIYIRVGGVVGAFLFAVGMFIVLTKQLQLFTGRCCRLLDESSAPSVFFELPLVWLGNFVGAALMAFIVKWAGVADSTEIFAAKMELIVFHDTFEWMLSFFLRGVICGFCIYLAVRGYRALAPHIGGYIALFLGVAAFILAGGEHCVADMFYTVAVSEYPVSPLSLAMIGIVTYGNLWGGFLCDLLSCVLEEDTK